MHPPSSAARREWRLLIPAAMVFVRALSTLSQNSLGPALFTNRRYKAKLIEGCASWTARTKRVWKRVNGVVGCCGSTITFKRKIELALKVKRGRSKLFYQMLDTGEYR